MINKTLFFREVKSNYLLFLIFAAVLTMYSTMIVAMFDPKLDASLKSMAESMPQLFSAFGMLNVGSTLLECVVGYLYGILFTAFPAVFIIILANRLIARYVDRGSMAYLLATPHTRGKIAATQAVFMILALLLLVVYLTALIIVTSQAMFPDELDIGGFLVVNVGLFGLLLFLGGFCFFCSCVFNEARLSYGVGAGVVIASILIQMIAQAGDKFESLKYATPLTLFNADGLIAGDSNAAVTCMILYIAGIVFLGAGILVFSKKDLSI